MRRMATVTITPIAEDTAQHRQKRCTEREFDHWVRALRPALHRRAYSSTRSSAEDDVLCDIPEPGLVAALAALPEPMRRAVYDTAVQGLTCREVAVAMGVPEGTVMSRNHRGRARLRRSLTRQGRTISKSPVISAAASSNPAVPTGASTYTATR